MYLYAHRKFPAYLTTALDMEQIQTTKNIYPQVDKIIIKYINKTPTKRRRFGNVHHFHRSYTLNQNLETKITCCQCKVHLCVYKRVQND